MFCVFGVVSGGWTAILKYTKYTQQLPTLAFNAAEIITFQRIQRNYSQMAQQFKVETTESQLTW